MAQGGKAESMAHLRSAIAGIEAHSGPVPARAPLKLSLARSLDGALGGGLADDSLHEIAPAQAGDGAAAMGFALAFVSLLIGAFSASYMATLGGRIRDDLPTWVDALIQPQAAVASE